MVASVVLNNVEKVYHLGEIKINALSDVTLEVPKRSILAIMGPSGSGKSTLLNLIGALDFPTRGTIEVAGSKLSELSDKKITLFRRYHVGFVFQSFNLIPVLSAQENIELPILFTKTKKSEREQRAQDLLKAVGLAERAMHTPDRLSGGEQQRIAIARALANNPELILADEPTGELDEATGSQIIDLLIDLVQKNDKTMIMVTHNYQIAEKAHRTIRIRSGKIVE